MRAGVRFDDFLNQRIFNASFQANLNQVAQNPMQSFTDLTNVRQFLTGNGIFAFFDTPWSPIYLLVLFLMHPVLGWTSVAFTVLLCLLAWGGHRVTAKRHERAMEGVAQSNTFLGAKLRNAETVQAMGMQRNLRGKWVGLYESQLVHQADALRMTQKVQALTKFFQYSQQSIILAVGALLAIKGELSVGGMIASNALMFNALRPISTLVGTWKQFIDAKVSYGRLEGLLDEYPVRTASHSAETVKGQVSLVNLVATAATRKQPILKGLTVEFAAGEVVAIVGPSGAGKSTLARCLLGIWPQTTGQVLLDGHPISQWSRDELGPHVGYLPQDIELFDGSLADNISRFSKVDSAAVIEAAKACDIHEMILRFPRGYDTPMGEAGGLFSGGQRQRIGLARAVYGNPSLVVLDEPNANLDDAGVAALLRTIADLRKRGSTVFLVVHQASMLAVADRILELHDGNITRFERTERSERSQRASQPPSSAANRTPS